MSLTLSVSAEAPSALRVQLFSAVQRRDDAEIARLRGALVQELGARAGVPEGGLQKHLPVDDSVPDLCAVNTRWTETLREAAGRFPWQNVQANALPRTRAVGRWVSALALARADAEPMREGAEYLISVQGSDGAFGYPVPQPDDHRRLAESARRLVAGLNKRGVAAVEKGYIVQAGDTGELNFDNGEAALSLLDAYAATNHAAWLEAAQRAAEWGLRQPLVPNWNYNSFHGGLAARLYRITGEPRYREASVALIRYGVLSGQMDNGNWFDAHNALPQYRAVMIRACLELCEALKGNGDAFAPELERRTRLACDALARDTLAWGADERKTWEALPVAAFSRALMVLGPSALWERALNVEVNAVLRDPTRPLPESMAVYLRYRMR
jgi:hypothetical protein